MSASPAFFTEIEDSLANGSRDRRGVMLRRVTDLFIVESEAYSGDEIDLFDDVILRLVQNIELSARAMLAERLAPVRNAPPKTVRALAFDNAIEVAGPILRQSERLDDPTLVENANEKSQEHLLAISRRPSISESVTDVLVTRGDQQVLLSAVENKGARFSDRGFETLVERSEGDDRLAERVGGRREIPPKLFSRLIAKASDVVRARLEKEHPHARQDVRRAVIDATKGVESRTHIGAPDYFAAHKIICALHAAGQLDDGKIGDLAKASRFEEVIAALSIVCRLPLAFVESAMLADRSETITIIVRSCDLSWSTAKAILLMRAGKHFTAGSDIAVSLANFERVRPATAKEIVRVYRLRAVEPARKS